MVSSESHPNYFPEQTYPYSVHVPLRLGNKVELKFDGDEVQLPFATHFTLRVSKNHITPREAANYVKRISIHLDAFTSAFEAEIAGKSLVMAVLWVAASKRVTIAFERWTGKFPFTVCDRTQSKGATLCGEARQFCEIPPTELATIAETVFNSNHDIAPSLLTSMSFYASARMEATEQARFIGLMTALEALSEQQDYGEDVAALVAFLASSEADYITGSTFYVDGGLTWNYKEQ